MRRSTAAGSCAVVWEAENNNASFENITIHNMHANKDNLFQVK